MNPKGFLTLGIETSCDDSGVALLRNEREVLGELLSSQIKDHARFGGVVPEFAARKHIENLLPLLQALLNQCGIKGEELDLIAVTYGPGLMGSLIVGVQMARALSQAWRVPVIGVNHLEGHLFAPLIDNQNLQPPFLSLIVSGGHTEIIKVQDYGVYELLGATRDDAAGEAYDKAAKIMGLPYPGGPEIDRLAELGNPLAFEFPIPLKHTDKVEFSFSGLKTALLWQVNKLRAQSAYEACLPIEDLCASFRYAVTQALINKIVLAVKQTGIKTVAISGGVAANSELRRTLAESAQWKAYLPPVNRCTDNATMIAMAGYNAWLRGIRSPSDMTPIPSLELISALNT